MEDLKNLIKRETSNMFSDTFYSKISNEILKLMNKETNNTGYIYFIKNGSNSKNVKIGCAINIDNRVKSYRTSFDKKTFILGYIKCENFFHVEKELHSFFSDKKTKGEWFELDSYDFIDIKNNYDFKAINDYYSNSVLIEKMIAKENIEDKNDLVISFAKRLVIDKEYFPFRLYSEFLKENPKTEILTVYWFGRELNKAIIYLGFKRKDSTKGGTRRFVLK